MSAAKISIIAILFLIAGLGACDPKLKTENGKTAQKEEPTPARSRPVSAENGKIFNKEGVKYLWGGENESWHFDISNSTLKDEQFHYGIGREKFHALTKPQFISAAEAGEMLADSVRFLVVDIEGDVRAYSIELLTHHEVVNDVVGGKPIMAAYCILADLGAIYDRMLDGRVYTFALSGYTYYDPAVWDGTDGFVMWDRETESLWWPLIGESVSGPMLSTKMKVYDQTAWAQTTWGEIKDRYPDIKILAPGQTMEPPQNWTHYPASMQLSEEIAPESVAPRWGENEEMAGK